MPKGMILGFAAGTAVCTGLGGLAYEYIQTEFQNSFSVDAAVFIDSIGSTSLDDLF